MEKIKQTEKEFFEIGKEDIEYQISSRRYYFVEFILKIIYSLIGGFISYLLYSKCLFNLDCNPIVTVFFSVLALSCFQAAGFPIEKLVNNIKLTQ